MKTNLKVVTNETLGAARAVETKALTRAAVQAREITRRFGEPVPGANTTACPGCHHRHSAETGACSECQCESRLKTRPPRSTPPEQMLYTERRGKLSMVSRLRKAFGVEG